MDKDERLKWLKQIEKDIYVCSLDSTFADDAKSCAIHSVIEELENQKTGHWIEKDGYDGDTYYDCSECGESFCLIEGTPTDNLYNYCPNCGAKMEGENE